MTGLRPLRQTVPKCEWNAISLIARRESLRENKLTNNMRDQKANELTIFVFEPRNGGYCLDGPDREPIGCRVGKCLMKASEAIQTARAKDEELFRILSKELDSSVIGPSRICH